MTSVDLARLSEIVERVSLLSQESRETALDDLDLEPHARREIELMLDKRSDWEAMLQHPVLRLAPTNRLDPIDWIGRRIGVYRIIDLIGQGGMGTVFLADRDDQEFSRRVALKIVSGSMSSLVLERFIREREALARLEHPAIARLYDGGTTDEGIPFLVMELVEGEPIDHYCDRNKSTLEDRLELFAAVCSAVSYAHQNLVVHRDLKPQNILVTADGDVKLLDFGIARILDPEIEGDTPSAAPEPMTPSHASPEQIRGEAITTSTDIYALGVILYRLFTGLSPYGSTLDRAELERLIIDQEPLLPSRAFSLQPPDTQHRIADHRKSSPSSLRRRLQGDLDAIVSRALEKNPTLRYRTAAALEDDLRRYRSRRPVEARSGDWWYLTWRFVARHAPGVSIAGMVAALLIGLSITLAIQTRRLARHRDFSQQQRLQSDQISDLLLELVHVSSVGGPKTGSLTDLILERVDSRVPHASGNRSLEAAYLHSFAKILLDLGRYSEAEELISRAVAIRTDLYGERSLETADSQNIAATIYQEQALFNESEALFRQILSVREQLLGKRHPDTASAQNNLGLILWERNLLDEAEALLTRALATTRATLGENHPGVLAAVSNLALVNDARGDKEAAIRLHREALALAESLFGQNHLRYAIATNNLAMSLHAAGELDEAESLARLSLEIRREIWGENHPMVGTALHNLAKIRRSHHDFEGARDLVRQALEVRARSLGFDHPDSLQSAMTLEQLGRIVAHRASDQQSRSNPTSTASSDTGIGEAADLHSLLSTLE